jgi:hypothetical protein
MGEYGFMKELNVQLISCPEPVYEKISPGIDQPASVLYPPVHSYEHQTTGEPIMKDRR